EFAVYVELALFDSGIADAHRGGVAIAAQVRQHLFRHAALAVAAVQHLHVFSVAGRRAREESPKAIGYFLMANLIEGFEREGRVAHPGVSIVPVPLAADALRQR